MTRAVSDRLRAVLARRQSSERVPAIPTLQPLLGRQLKRAWAFVRLARPQFLVGGISMFGLGTVMASATGHDIDWRRCAAGQGVVTTVQLMTHFANDYFDFDADRANDTPTRWSGGSRVLPSCELSRSVALIAARCLAACALLGMILVWAIGTSIIVLALMSGILSLAWAYSAPPLKLHSRGCGELSTAVLVAGLVPWFGYSLQSANALSVVLFATVPLICLQFAMLLVVDVPDRLSDEGVGKRTLVVRLGVERAATLHNCAVFGAYASSGLMLMPGLPRGLTLSFVWTAPLAMVQIIGVARGDFLEPRRWETMAFRAVALVFLATLASIVTLLLL